LESRERKNGKIAHYAISIDWSSGKRMSQIFEGKNDAQFLLNVLNAHKSDTDAALQSARQADGDAYTVEKMFSDHVGLLTTANGCTIATRVMSGTRLRGLGQLDAAKVGYAEIVEWIQSMQAKNLAAKTIANVHGLIAAAFNTMVRQKKRGDNPCKGIALPKNDHTQEIATFLTMDEWIMLSTFLRAPYLQLFMFSAHTGLRIGGHARGPKSSRPTTRAMPSRSATGRPIWGLKAGFCVLAASISSRPATMRRSAGLSPD
jgi:hypothetical protein